VFGEKPLTSAHKKSPLLDQNRGARQKAAPLATKMGGERRRRGKVLLTVKDAKSDSRRGIRGQNRGKGGSNLLRGSKGEEHSGILVSTGKTKNGTLHPYSAGIPERGLKGRGGRG